MRQSVHINYDTSLKNANPRVEVVIIAILRDILRPISRLHSLAILDDLYERDLRIFWRKRYGANRRSRTCIKLCMTGPNIERDGSIIAEEGQRKDRICREICISGTCSIGANSVFWMGAVPEYHGIVLRKDRWVMSSRSHHQITMSLVTYTNGWRRSVLVPINVVLCDGAPGRVDKSINIKWRQGTQVHVRINVPDVVRFSVIVPSHWIYNVVSAGHKSRNIPTYLSQQYQDWHHW